MKVFDSRKKQFASLVLLSYGSISLNLTDGVSVCIHNILIINFDKAVPKITICISY